VALGEGGIELDGPVDNTPALGVTCVFAPPAGRIPTAKVFAVVQAYEPLFKLKLVGGE
jgi:hypothetical protein